MRFAATISAEKSLSGVDLEQAEEMAGLRKPNLQVIVVVSPTLYTSLSPQPPTPKTTVPLAVTIPLAMDARNREGLRY